MPRYSYSFAGKCELDEEGIYTSLEDCEAAAQGRENKEVNYLIYQYDPSSAVPLAPSDRVEVIRRLTGVNVSPEYSRPILTALDRLPAETSAEEFIQALLQILTLVPANEIENVLELIQDAGLGRALEFFTQGDLMHPVTELDFRSWRRNHGRAPVISITIKLEDEDSPDIDREELDPETGRYSMNWASIFERTDPHLSLDLLREGDVVQFWEEDGGPLFLAYYNGEQLVNLDSRNEIQLTDRPRIECLPNTAYFNDIFEAVEGSTELRTIQLDSGRYRITELKVDEEPYSIFRSNHITGTNEWLRSTEEVTIYRMTIRSDGGDREYLIYTPRPHRLEAEFTNNRVLSLEVGAEYDQEYKEPLPEEQERMLIDADGYVIARAEMEEVIAKKLATEIAQAEAEWSRRFPGAFEVKNFLGSRHGL